MEIMGSEISGVKNNIKEIMIMMDLMGFEIYILFWVSRLKRTCLTLQ